MYSLLTYDGVNELRKIQDECVTIPFVFGKTKEEIDNNPCICIDITAVVYFLEGNKSSIQPAYANFENMTDKTRVIVSNEAAPLALKLLPYLFCEVHPFFENEEFDDNDTSDAVLDFKDIFRRVLFRYNSNDDLDEIIKYVTEKHIPFTTFSQANGELRKQLGLFNKHEKLAIIDLTSISYAIEGNKSLIYLIEEFLESMPNLSIVVLTSQIDLLLTYFPLFFEGQEPITRLLPELSGHVSDEPTESSVIKITELDNDGFQNFWKQFEHNLIGHQNFKSRLNKDLRHFISLNRVKEQRVYSLFLYGASGIGKTETARLIANSLKEESYLPKINFQNYSSQDSLNSLIGSPAGYVGCEHGELSDKVRKSNVGIILCDEFEKTTRPVFSFFLELLEEGKFTDSMAREYDMDGYIIVFTSNIQSEADYKKIIPPELQTRFDLVCEFEPPTEQDKRAFVSLLIEKAKSKYADLIEMYGITDQEFETVCSFNYMSEDSLRDIRKVFNARIMDLFDKKAAREQGNAI